MTLRVALDPTIEINQQMTPASPTSEQCNVPTETTPLQAQWRIAIPAAFLKPWELKLTRDEAIYDMTLNASRSRWRRLIGWFRRRISSNEMRKWHALLQNKPLDEQLWEVRPPKGGVHDARIRRWTEQTLQLAGYDSNRMLAEWEIFWRRKGLE